MFAKISVSDLMNYPLLSAFTHRNTDKIISQVLSKMQYFESVIYDLKNIKKDHHYFLLDENSNLYDIDYEKKVLSPHARNIYNLSLIIEEFLEDSVENPIDLFCELESLICSPQFYRNILINKKLENLSLVLQKLTASIDKSIIMLTNHKNNEIIYSNFLSLIKKTDYTPDTLSEFLMRLAETREYFKDAAKEAKTIKSWY